MSKEPFNETPTHSALHVDRSTPVGVSNDGTDRGALHTVIKNDSSNPIPVAFDGTIVVGQVDVTHSVLPDGGSTSANQVILNTEVGAANESAAATDTATSGLNGLIKRLLQRVTNLINSLSDGTSRFIILDKDANPLTSTISTLLKRSFHFISPNDRVSGTLGALNSSITLEMEGHKGAGFQIETGTLIGTIRAEASCNNGVSYDFFSFFDNINSVNYISGIVFTSANTKKILSVIVPNGVTHVRATVTAYTSGSATATLSATENNGPFVIGSAAAFTAVSKTTTSLSANTPALILASNPNRKWAYIGNNSGLSALRIQYTNSTGLTTTSGMPVGTNGNYEIEGSKLFTGDIYGVSGGAITVTVYEGTTS